MIPGGPGAGIDVVYALRSVFHLDQWTKNHDVYLFDPRGVGASSPVRCTHPDPPRAPVIRSQAQLTALARVNRTFADSCAAGTGELIRHLSSIDSARDIEVIRLAIGQRNGLVAYSGSYGTNYAGAYLERNGHHVRALVMDAVADHSVSLPTYAARNARGVENAFNRFAHWCDTSSECALHGQDVRAVFDRLVAAATLPAPGAPRPATGADVRSGTADLMSAGRLPIGWPAVAAMIKKARDGDASGFVSQPSGSGLFRGVLCSDFDVPTTYDPLSAPVARLRHQAPRFGEWRYWDVVARCVGHPHPATNPPHRLKVSRNARVLVSSNTHDPATPLINALAIWRQIPGARLLIADADGHQALPMSQCARDAYLRFFDRPHALPSLTWCDSTT